MNTDKLMDEVEHLVDVRIRAELARCTACGDALVEPVEKKLRAAIEQAMEAARADGFAWGMKAALDENCAAQPQPELTDAKLDDIYLKVVGPKGGKLSRAYARAVIAADRAKETK